MDDIWTLRHRRRWSQTDLSRASGVSQDVISRLETAEVKRPSLATALALAKAFKVDVTKLKFGRPRKAPIRRKPRRPVAPPTPADPVDGGVPA